MDVIHSDFRYLFPPAAKLGTLAEALQSENLKEKVRDA